MSGKKELWARYQSLLVERPITMQLVQSALLTAAGNATAQKALSAGGIALGPLMEQVFVQVCFISPIAACWIPFLTSMKLHWTLATFVDQFLVHQLAVP